MGRFVKGDVVVVAFPFSDLSSAKRRPALVIATPVGDDVILCQITSRRILDRYAFAIQDADFLSGSLHQESNVRPNRIFTADMHIIRHTAGHLRDEITARVIDRIITILGD